MYCLYNNFLNVISLLRLDKTVIFVCLLFYYHHQAEYSMSKYISTHSPLRIYLNLRIQNQHSLLCMLCFVVFLLKVLHRYTDLTACSENEGFAVVCLTEMGRLVPCKQWMVVRKSPWTSGTSTVSVQPLLRSQSMSRRHFGLIWSVELIMADKVMLFNYNVMYIL